MAKITGCAHKANRKGCQYCEGQPEIDWQGFYLSAEIELTTLRSRLEALIEKWEWDLRDEKKMFNARKAIKQLREILRGEE